MYFLFYHEFFLIKNIIAFELNKRESKRVWISKQQKITTMIICLFMEFPSLLCPKYRCVLLSWPPPITAVSVTVFGDFEWDKRDSMGQIEKRNYQKHFE